MGRDLRGKELGEGIYQQTNMVVDAKDLVENTVAR